MDLIELRTLQDWVVERRLRLVPGVADVLVLGGKTKEFQAEIDLDRMRAFRPDAAADHRGDRRQQLQRRRPHDLARRAVGERARARRAVGSVKDIGQHRPDAAGRPAGAVVRRRQGTRSGFRPRLGMAGRDDTTDVVNGIVLMQKFERTMEVVTRVREAVAEAQHRRHAAEGRADRAVLRPRRPGRHHREHGAAQHDVRRRADLPDPVAVPRQSALGDHRRGDHSRRAVRRRHHHGVAGRIRQPAFDRRHRSRHHRRCDRHHGGEHLPPSRASHQAGDRRSARRA